jgi:hypothetical protein
MPLPQLVTTPRLPVRTSRACSVPKAFSKASIMRCDDASVVNFNGSGSESILTSFCWRKAVKGREREYGMCPDWRPGRGSGSVPRYLHYIRVSELSGINDYEIHTGRVNERRGRAPSQVKKDRMPNSSLLARNLRNMSYGCVRTSMVHQLTPYHIRV